MVKRYSVQVEIRTSGFSTSFGGVGVLDLNLELGVVLRRFVLAIWRRSHTGHGHVDDTIWHLGSGLFLSTDQASEPCEHGHSPCCEAESLG